MSETLTKERRWTIDRTIDYCTLLLVADQKMFTVARESIEGIRDNLSASRAALEQAERERDAAVADAERWRRLTGSSRVRVLGHAQLGRPDAHIGVEFWGEYRDASPEQSAEDVRELTTYADGLAAGPQAKEKTNE